MKALKVIVIVVFLCPASISLLFSQDTTQKRSVFLPQQATFNNNLNFRWFLNDGFNAQFIEQMYNGVRFQFSNNIDVFVQHKTFFAGDSVRHVLSDVRLSYYKLFTPSDNIPVLSNGAILDVKLGMFEWFPTYSNVQQIIENADKFIYPSKIYGGSILLNSPLTKDQSLRFQFAAHSGDLINKELDPELLDVFLNYTRLFKYEIGVSAQVGQAQGSQHVVNYAHLLFQPKIEKLSFNVKLGKLPTYDNTPYGFHIGLSREFKYVLLGGYYERRLNQDTKGHIAGFSWHIKGPPALAKFVSTFSFIYDINSNTVWMWIPLLKIDIQYN